MQVYFKPDKKPWEFWKRNRYLKHGKDYLIANQRVVFAKAFKGQLEFTYSYSSN
jgi:hypothetical protein